MADARITGWPSGTPTRSYSIPLDLAADAASIQATFAQFEALLLHANIGGNLPTSKLNSGTNADATTVWRGDTSWGRVNFVATTVKTSAYTAAVLDLVRTSTTSAAFTVTTPASPSDGDRVRVMDAVAAGSWGTNTLTVAANSGQTINGAASIAGNAHGAAVDLTYNSATTNWQAVYLLRASPSVLTILANAGSTVATALAGTSTFVQGLLATASANLFRVAVNKGTVALTDGTTIATDCSTGNFFTVTLGGNRTLSNPTNLAAGASYTWRITQDATGSRTLAYGTNWKWGTTGTPTLTTTASKSDYIGGYSPDGTIVEAVLTKGGF